MKSRFCSDSHALIDLEELSALCGFADVGQFQQAHRRCVEEALAGELHRRDERWSESVAVESQAKKIKEKLGIAVSHREINDGREQCALREPGVAYRPDFGIETGPLRLEDAIFWEENRVNACG